MPVCVYQLGILRYFPIGEGIGSCSECKPDRTNNQCRGYYPITIEQMIKSKLFSESMIEKMLEKFPELED